MFRFHPCIRLIQMAKKPAIIATTAATPPFANKEVAGEEVEGVEAEELDDEELVGTELVDDTPEEAMDPEVMEDPEALDAEDDAPLEVPELVLAGVVYGIELGVAVAVGAGNEVHSEDCKARAAWRSVGQCS